MSKTRRRFGQRPVFISSHATYVGQLNSLTAILSELLEATDEVSASHDYVKGFVMASS